MQICANVQSPLLGLPDIDKNKVIVHTGDKPYIEKVGKVEQLHRLGSHLHAAAMVLPGLRKPNEIQLDKSVCTRYNPPLRSTLIVGDIEDVSQQANIPKQLRQPPQPAKQEQETHRLPVSHTHALDYAYIRSSRLKRTNPDMQRVNNKSLHGNSYIEERPDKVLIDTAEEVRHGERLWTIDHPG
eukprot:4094329-Amphidinium_carterae.2